MLWRFIDEKINDKSRLYLDSGADSHIAVDKNYFLDLNKMENSKWNPKITGLTDEMKQKQNAMGR